MKKKNLYWKENNFRWKAHISNFHSSSGRKSSLQELRKSINSVGLDSGMSDAYGQHGGWDVLGEHPGVRPLFSMSAPRTGMGGGP